MPAPRYLQNSFTSGELAAHVQDRVDLEPEQKGFTEGTNLVVTTTGPLRKRRGFWDVAAAADASAAVRLVPFRRGVADALMLEFHDKAARVWAADGSPLMYAGQQVTFATPYAAADLDGLRFHQVADVIYFRHRDGLPPQTLSRRSNANWTWAVEAFPNGPWLPENTDETFTVTPSGGTAKVDANTATGAYYYPAAQELTLKSSAALFTPDMVGAQVRIRAGTGSGSAQGWTPGLDIPVGHFVAYGGLTYLCTRTLGSTDKLQASNPPVHISGVESDGCNTLEYMHDGAGIFRIDAYVSPTEVTGWVVAGIPIGSWATSLWALDAYNNHSGWPRMWPAAIEERLVGGATAANLDMLDLTRTAGFTPLKEDFHPSLGTGAVVDTDAIRRRLGDDASEIVWAMSASFLLAGSLSGEHLIAGGYFGNPITPSSVTSRQLSAFGSADVKPAKVHKGIVWVTRGGQTLRSLQVDPQQGESGEDLSFLATHISERGIVQLAWLPSLDNQLWCRLADGGLAVFTWHQEQQVRGWTRQALPPGWVCEDIVTLPGPGRLETLWVIVSRLKEGAVQRRIWMQSRPADALFLDGAAYYEGPPESVIGGLDAYEGELVRIKADGAQLADQTVTGGAITLDAPAREVMVGLPLPIAFMSGRVDLAAVGGTLGQRQRLTGIDLHVRASVCWAGVDGGRLEKQSGRQVGDIARLKANDFTTPVTIAADTSRDPRIVIQEDSVFDFWLYSMRPSVAVGG